MTEMSAMPHLSAASQVQEGMKEWGEIPPLSGVPSQTRGILLHKNNDGGEAGLWVCTPGIWRCDVSRDEFCHFLAGECEYEHESGERLMIRADCSVFFPAGWKGVCRVHKTVRKVYMIR